ncbi:hypothetical protein BgAZ_102460 [Babesia gibsoni]|uniref:Uncharacterized protein n=1 Tax=Babesia gibsoni TaxID=33632 RepID=A0AAD8URG1_BABGI|nr:hypothetical protein BgAZ_102460 [Babesia gibsoni]
MEACNTTSNFREMHAVLPDFISVNCTTVKMSHGASRYKKAHAKMRWKVVEKEEDPSFATQKKKDEATLKVKK